MSLYEAMHRHGPEHFFIVPLQITRREDIDHLEMQWINRVGSHVYNVRTESRWKSTRMFQHFYAPCSAPPSGHDWNDYVNTLIQKRGVSLADLIFARSRGKRLMTKHLFACLEQRLLQLTQSRTGRKLPRAITFPYPPSHDPAEASKAVLELLHAVYQDLPVPPAIKEYLRSVTRLVGKRAHSLADVLCTKGTGKSWDELRAQSQATCQCAQLHPHLPRVSDCVVVRTMHGIRCLNPTWAPFLGQCLGNSVIGSKDTYLQWAVKASHKLANSCPFFPPEWRNTLTLQFKRIMSVTYDNAVRNLPDCPRLDRITAVKRDIYRSMVILPLDKNGGKPVLLCKRLYAQLLIEQYSDEKQFSVIADCQSPAQATATAMQLIYQNAVQYRIAPHIRMGKRYAPPSSFVSMKNKSQEAQGTVSMRILFSYFRHPTKQFARKIGRCLNLLITEGVNCMCTLEMQNMDGIIPWVVQVNKLAESWTLPRPQNHRTHRYVKFFEVDVKQMFPRLRRGNPSATLQTVKSCKTKDVGVWEAVLLIVNWVAEAKHIRMKANGMWFGIHEQKHLDVIRKAYGDQYTNIPWHQVEAYLRFELFANDYFVLGSRVMRQLLGVAIGGVLSSQFATMYCMAREHLWAQHHDFKVPWSRTRPTPGPLGITAPPLRYRDNCGGICAGNRPVSRVQTYFQKVLNLELQFEGEGQSWTVLMAHLTLHPSTSQITLTFKKKVNWDDPAERRLVRYPDYHSPNARDVVRGFTPNCARNCLKYAIPPDQTTHNIREFVHEMNFKGYPSSWWAPTLRRVMLDPLLPVWAPFWTGPTDRRSLLQLLALSDQDV